MDGWMANAISNVALHRVALVHAINDGLYRQATMPK